MDEKTKREALQRVPTRKLLASIKRDLANIKRDVRRLQASSAPKPRKTK